MKYNGIISKKIKTIQDRLIKIKVLLPIKTKQLKDDYFLKSGIERTLQVCIEAVLDISNRINSLEGYSPITESFDSIKRLEDLKVIKRAEKYRNMVKFRNFIVHRYESVENEELVNICNNHLNDFEDFIKEIESYK